jgi:hypothetical protein
MEPLVVLAHAPPGGHKPFWHARSTWTWPRVLAGHRMDRPPLVACFAAHRGKACIRPCWDFCGRGSDLILPLASSQTSCVEWLAEQAWPTVAQSCRPAFGPASPWKPGRYGASADYQTLDRHFGITAGAAPAH